MDTRKELESLAGDKDALSNATAAARIVADMMQQHERENKRLWAVVVTLVVVLANHGRVYGVGRPERPERGK